MLSGETAAGRYPLESVLMMDRIIREAEANVTESCARQRIGDLHISETIAEAICHAAEELHMKADRRLHGNRRSPRGSYPNTVRAPPSSLFLRIRILAAK